MFKRMKEDKILYDKQCELYDLRRKKLHMEFEGEDYVDDE
jgi:hypothetical protein